MRTGENIFKRKDGRWEARYIKCYDENGKAKQICSFLNGIKEKQYRKVRYSISLKYY